MSDDRKYGTSSNTMLRGMQPISAETLKRAMQEIDLLPKPDQWIVIDPQGRMHRGTVEEVARLLLQILMWIGKALPR